MVDYFFDAFTSGATRAIGHGRACGRKPINAWDLAFWKWPIGIDCSPRRPPAERERRRKDGIDESFIMDQEKRRELVREAENSC